MNFVDVSLFLSHCCLEVQWPLILWRNSTIVTRAINFKHLLREVYWYKLYSCRLRHHNWNWVQTARKILLNRYFYSNTKDSYIVFTDTQWCQLGDFSPTCRGNIFERLASLQVLIPNKGTQPTTQSRQIQRCFVSNKLKIKV